MDKCTYLGCLYNEDGYCNYDNASIKYFYARVCTENDIVGDMEVREE